MPKRGLTSRGKRAMKAREPKLVEGERQLLTLRGPKASARGVCAMQFLAGMKKGISRALVRKNDIRPFEDLSSLEFLSEVNGCSAFALTSHTKKRPDNLVLVRAPRLRAGAPRRRRAARPPPAQPAPRPIPPPFPPLLSAAGPHL